MPTKHTHTYMHKTNTLADTWCPLILQDWRREHYYKGHTCIHPGWEKSANKLITQMCHTLLRCSLRMMDRVRVRTGDTEAHPFISVTWLIPLFSHPLRHSTSRQAPPPKPSSPLRASVATLSLLRMPTFLHESHLFLPPFPAFTPLCLVKSRGRDKKKKQDGKWVYLSFFGSLLRQDRLPHDTSLGRCARILM